MRIGFIFVVAAVFSLPFVFDHLFIFVEWKETSSGKFRQYRNCYPVVLGTSNVGFGMSQRAPVELSMEAKAGGCI